MEVGTIKKTYFTILIRFKNCFFVYLFFRSQVLEGEDESPIEVSFSGQRSVVNVGLLGVVGSFQPPFNIKFFVDTVSTP
jgi:hypothetical protein